MSKANEVIVAAYEKGYRVLDDGTVLSHKGRALSTKIANGRRYPKMCVVVSKKRESILTHRFAAYCFYGDDVFSEGVQVRHLNGDTSDISRENIKLGTAKDNHADKSDEAKQRTTDAVIRASIGRPPVNRILNDAQACEIREKLKAGARGVELAKEYGVSKQVISGIKLGRKYKIQNRETEVSE